MALVGIELETLVSESDALTTQPPLIYLAVVQSDEKRELNKMVKSTEVNKKTA